MVREGASGTYTYSKDGNVETEEKDKYVGPWRNNLKHGIGQ